MRSIVIHGPKDIRLDEVEAPERRPDELLLKVACVCICGSDLHYYLEGGLGTKKILKPQIPGHEIAAWVWDDDAERWGLKKGQLVAVEPTRTCGVCEHCMNGRPNLCPEQHFHGGPPWVGGMAEYFTAPRGYIIPVPADFTPEMAAALEPVGIGIHALRKADLQLGQSVTVLGAGPIGQIALQLARGHGAGRIIVVEPVAARRRKALKLGADDAVASYGEAVELTKGHGTDLVIEATNSPDGFAHAVQVVKWAGRIVLIGIPTGINYNAMDAMPFRSKEVTVLTCNKMGHVFPAAIEVVKRGMIDMDALLTHRVTLDGAVAAFNRQGAYEDGVIKTVVYPNGIPEARP